MRALRIAPDTTVTELDLPESGAHSTIRDHIGTTGPVDHGVYHRRALLHIHGDGHRMGLAQNITAWALASTWRGLALYPIHGPVVVTGRAHDGEWPRWTTSWLSTRTRLRRLYAKH
jgi:2-polyprenyl-6-methoxyphenol hydroxylase-like FAD-dependent oxidoreductase